MRQHPKNTTTCVHIEYEQSCNRCKNWEQYSHTVSKVMPNNHYITQYQMSVSISQCPEFFTVSNRYTTVVIIGENILYVPTAMHPAHHHQCTKIVWLQTCLYTSYTPQGGRKKGQEHWKDNTERTMQKNKKADTQRNVWKANITTRKRGFTDNAESTSILKWQYKYAEGQKCIVFQYSCPFCIIHSVLLSFLHASLWCVGCIQAEMQPDYFVH